MAHTGTRIRDRRLALGLSQTDFAARLGISGSYLNLIEHNRRRIGPKLLEEIARVLMVDAAALDSGAGPEVIAALESVGKGAGFAAPDLAQATDLATRFPRWADVLATQAAVIAGKADAGSTQLHEIVSAIASTAQTLVDMPDLPEDWQDRFARRIARDSLLLHGLLLRAQPATGSSAWAAANAALNDRAWHKAFLAGEDVAFATLAGEARDLVRRYLADLGRMVSPALRQAVTQTAALRDLGLPLVQALQLHAELSDGSGLLRMDARGQVMRFKPLVGMEDLPDCLVWPIFAEELSLGRPLARVVQVEKALYHVTAMVAPHLSDADNALPRDRVMVWHQADSTQGPDVIACAQGACRH